MLSNPPLVPIVLLVTFLSLVVSVMALVGVPLGGMGALVVPFAALALTIPMALIFSHGPSDGTVGH